MGTFIAKVNRSELSSLSTTGINTNLFAKIHNRLTSWI